MIRSGLPAEYGEVLRALTEAAASGRGARPTVVTLRDGEIVRWRDYLNPVAIFDALGWPAR